MLPSYYEFTCPVKICSGVNALDNIPAELERLGVSRPLVVTDQGVSKAGLVELVTSGFAESGMTIAAVFDDVPPDSALTACLELARLYREKSCDCMIAVGGGSVIDTAKGANILVSEDTDNLLQFAGADVLTRRLKPLVVVPTTSGTGSEVTIFAVISDPERKRKMLFTSVHLMPDVGVLDPRMTLTLPPHITAATAMDAMTHALEAFISLGKNPLSDAYASAAIRLIVENLVPVLENPKDQGLRLALANASTMAGIAFSNAGVGIVHALGHSLGSVCHIPHGVAMNVFLPHGLEYNLSKAREQVAELLLPLAGQELYTRTPPEQRAEESIACIRRLQYQLYSLTKLPRNLKETGKVDRDKFEEIAKTALGDGAIMYNPEGLDFDDLMAVQERACD